MTSRENVDKLGAAAEAFLKAEAERIISIKLSDFQKFIPLFKKHENPVPPDTQEFSNLKILWRIFENEIGFYKDYFIVDDHTGNPILHMPAVFLTAASLRPEDDVIARENQRLQLIQSTNVNYSNEVMYKLHNAIREAQLENTDRLKSDMDKQIAIAKLADSLLNNTRTDTESHTDSITAEIPSDNASDDPIPTPIDMDAAWEMDP